MLWGTWFYNMMLYYLRYRLYDIQHADLSSHPTVWQNISRNLTKISKSAVFEEYAVNWYTSLVSRIETLPLKDENAKTLKLMVCASLAQDLLVSEHLKGDLSLRVSNVVTNLWDSTISNEKNAVEVFLYKSILNNKTLTLPFNALMHTILRKGQISNTYELQALLNIAQTHPETHPYIGECLAYNMFHPAASSSVVAFDKELIRYWLELDSTSLAWKQTAIAVALHYVDSSPQIQLAGHTFTKAIEDQWPNEWADIQQKIEMLKSVSHTNTLYSIEHVDLLTGIEKMSLVQTPLPKEFVHEPN